jgi:hypothetical protein
MSDTRLAVQVLRAVMKNDFATLYFNDPVDPDALGIPQYREVIKASS